MLLRCSEKKDLSEWNTWRENHPDEEIHLEGADLRGAHLEGADLEGAKLMLANLGGTILLDACLRKADLREANMKQAALTRADFQEADLTNADLGGSAADTANLKYARCGLGILTEISLRGAHLEGVDLQHIRGRRAGLQGAHLEGAHLRKADLRRADLSGAHLRGANLQEAHLEKADLSDADLRGADFRKAIVDGGTLIWGCKVNKWKREKWYTDFAGVGLNSARVQPGIKQLLQYNIRRSNWEKKYKWPNEWKEWSAAQRMLKAVPVALGWLGKNILVRWFWWVSDYGHSTRRILAWFFGLAGLFALFYCYCPSLLQGLNEPNVQEHPILRAVRALYFSIVTMTTLGFGDIHANPASWLGHVLLMIQVLLGYVMLAALVTHLGILFTADGPAGTFTPLTKEEKERLRAIEKGT